MTTADQNVLNTDLAVLAASIARNREIAGLHYPGDSDGGARLADLLSTAAGVKLTAIFAPEHGFRGTAEAGVSVRRGVDARTGAPIHSLYGASKKPTPATSSSHENWRSPRKTQHSEAHPTPVSSHRA